MAALVKETTPLVEQEISSPLLVHQIASGPYKSTLRVLVLTACVGVFIGIFAGLLTTEIRLTIPYSKIPPGMHLEAVLHLEILHGHIITVLAILPITMAGMLTFARMAGGSEIASKFLPRFAMLYLIGAWLSMAIMATRAFQVAYLAKNGATDFDAIDEKVLFSAPLRTFVYICAHIPLTGGLVSFVVLVAASLWTPKQSSLESVGLR